MCENNGITLTRLLYNGGPQVSELVTLRWRNLVDSVASVTGKGGKTRVVRPSRGIWAELRCWQATDHKTRLTLPFCMARRAIARLLVYKDWHGARSGFSKAVVAFAMRAQLRRSRHGIVQRIRT